MKEVWGTTSLTSDYWSLPKQPQGNGEKRHLNEVVYDSAHITDMRKQVELHEKIRNDDDYDDWEYGTEPDIGKLIEDSSPFGPTHMIPDPNSPYTKIPKRY